MNPITRMLQAKAIGFTSSIEKMSPDERIRSLPGRVGRDYNRLRGEVAKAFPEIEPFLPPLAEMFNGNSGSEYTSGNYGEIWVYASQLNELIQSVDRES